MSFADRLRDAQPDFTAANRTWAFIPYDQLHDGLGLLADHPPEEVGIVLVETSWKGDRRPYHRQKLALILANQRHFALEQARRGVAVEYLTGDRRYGAILREQASDIAPLTLMRPAERELRTDLAPLVDDGFLNVVPHNGWLTAPSTFRDSQDGPPWRMDAFYRAVRQKSGILMDDGSPVGGQYSFDGDNRESWDGDPPAPTPPTFEVTPIKREVAELIRREFPDHPGDIDLSRLPATREDAVLAWNWAREECMDAYGPYQDAMSTRSRTLFHTQLSPLINIHRLRPSRVLSDALELDIPINSKEGFVRQLLGWREFMRHVHRETDGFRELPDDFDALDDPPTEPRPGDGGWSRWSGEAWTPPSAEDDGVDGSEMDGGASPDYLDTSDGVPPEFWGENSGLRCLDEVVDAVWADGWSHHITRLMVLSNIATLVGVEPRDLTDWFWVAYTDAFDWVVEPNVLGMGTFGLGNLFVTKPYVSGSNYIDDMSDYCDDCRFDPGEDCPLKASYWAFLDEHEEQLDDNPRMGLMLGTMRNRGDQQRAADRRVLQTLRRHLESGDELHPEDIHRARTPDD